MATRRSDEPMPCGVVYDVRMVSCAAGSTIDCGGDACSTENAPDQPIGWWLHGPCPYLTRELAGAALHDGQGCERTLRTSSEAQFPFSCDILV